MESEETTGIIKIRVLGSEPLEIPVNPETLVGIEIGEFKVIGYAPNFAEHLKKMLDGYSTQKPTQPPTHS